MLWHHLFWYRSDYGLFVQQIGIIGKSCVYLFLLVSGYGLTKQFDKLQKLNITNSVRFVLLRLAKFYLQYWFYFVVVILVGISFGYSLSEAYPNRNLLKSLFLDGFGLMGYSSYNTTWWFNKLIIQLYLIFPLLFFALYNRVMAIISLILIIILQQFVPINFFFLAEGGLLVFFVGMFIAKYPIKNYSVKILLPFVIIILSGFVYLRFNIEFISVNLIYAGIALFTSFLLILIGKYYAFPILKFLGSYATAMYFIHTLIQKILSEYLYSISFSVFVFIVLLATTLSICWLLRKLEKISRYGVLKNNITNLVKQI